MHQYSYSCNPLTPTYSSIHLFSNSFNRKSYPETTKSQNGLYNLTSDSRPFSPLNQDENIGMRQKICEINEEKNEINETQIESKADELDSNQRESITGDSVVTYYFDDSSNGGSVAGDTEGKGITSSIKSILSLNSSTFSPSSSLSLSTSTSPPSSLLKPLLLNHPIGSSPTSSYSNSYSSSSSTSTSKSNILGSLSSSSIFKQLISLLSASSPISSSSSSISSPHFVRYNLAQIEANKIIKFNFFFYLISIIFFLLKIFHILHYFIILFSHDDNKSINGIINSTFFQFFIIFGDVGHSIFLFILIYLFIYYSLINKKFMNIIYIVFSKYYQDDHYYTSLLTDEFDSNESQLSTNFTSNSPSAPLMAQIDPSSPSTLPSSPPGYLSNKLDWNKLRENLKTYFESLFKYETKKRKSKEILKQNSNSLSQNDLENNKKKYKFCLYNNEYDEDIQNNENLSELSQDFNDYDNFYEESLHMEGDLITSKNLNAFLSSLQHRYNEVNEEEIDENKFDSDRIHSLHSIKDSSALIDDESSYKSFNLIYKEDEEGSQNEFIV